MRDSLTKLFGSHLVNLDMLPDDAVIIDAGASVGDFIRDIRKRVKEPYIFAIEPNKNNALQLREIEGIIVYEAALVGEKEGREILFREINGLHEWGNVNNLYSNRNAIQYYVETINLKDLLDTIPIEPIHYLKMDIEGSESDVINDMNEDTASKIQQISFEIHDASRFKLASRLQDIGYITLYENGELYAVREGL